MERKFDAYKLARSMYPSIFNSFPVIRTANAKNRHFHAAHIFVSTGDAPAISTQYVAWMERQLTLRPISQAGPMRNHREGISVVFVTRHHQANLMVCVVCSCCAISPYREVCRAKGGIRSAERPCAMIFTLLGL